VKELIYFITNATDVKNTLKYIWKCFI